MKNFIRIIALSIALLSASAQAVPVQVGATVSGSANHWTYDFAFTNDMDFDWKLYFFGVELPNPGALVTNGGFADWGYGTWMNSGPGSSDVVYNAIWLVDGFKGIAAGETVHLRVFDSGSAPLSVANWFAYAISSPGPYYYYPDAEYTGPHLGEAFNPGFEGQATVTAVPEPETCAMLLAGLGLVGIAARRKLAASSLPRRGTPLRAGSAA